jgi:hypothetical protein
VEANGVHGSDAKTSTSLEVKGVVPGGPWEPLPTDHRRGADQSATVT